MAIQTIKVPDIGGAEGVEVIEISVKVGDVVAEGDSIVVLETDKASMEIPADKAGKVVAIKVNLGDKVSQDAVLLEVEAEGSAAAAPQTAAPVAAAPASVAAAATSSPATATGRCPPASWRTARPCSRRTTSTAMNTAAPCSRIAPPRAPRAAFSAAVPAS